jgi:hypothetical protein
MPAQLILRERTQIADDRFVEIVIWQLPAFVRGSDHGFKYRLAFVVNGVCVIRYDNEAGKGDHKHIGVTERGYVFSTIDKLIVDFRSDVMNWRPE